jgi:hypothetical protein
MSFLFVCCTYHVNSPFLVKEGINAAADKEKVLIRHLAASWLTLVFTRIDFTIYQSQLKILEFLNCKRSPDSE